MKSIRKYGLLGISLILLLVLSGGCKKSFLEIVPKGRLIAKSTNDYNLMLNTRNVFNHETDAQVVLGDDVVGLEPYFSGEGIRTLRLFRWEDVVYEPGQAAAELSMTMSNLYLYNTIINEVMESADGTEAQKRSIEAEAKAGRAWTYFLLIQYYGKPYDQATAATDPGFPIVKEADATTNSFSRATVKEVYDFIIADLKEAIPNLPVQLTNRMRMSRAVAEATLGKVYMFMGRFSDALPLLSDAFLHLENAAVPIQLYNYNTTMQPGGSMEPDPFYGPNYPALSANRENLYSKQFMDSWSSPDRPSGLVLSPAAKALYNADDLRLNMFTNKPSPDADPLPAGLIRRWAPWFVAFGMSLADMYLLKAECRGRLNDLAGAVADVETLRKNRMPLQSVPVPATVASDRKELVNFILQERIREFALTGYRWFDMRRLFNDPDYESTVGTSHQLYSANGDIVETFTLRPERLVLRFPQMVMAQNPGMENNP